VLLIVIGYENVEFPLNVDVLLNVDVVLIVIGDENADMPLNVVIPENVIGPVNVGDAIGAFLSI
jgi:hypothetical protein